MIEIPLSVLKAATLAANPDQGQYSLDVVHVREFASSYLLTATDGRVLVRIRGDIPTNNVGEGEDTYLLPISAVLQLCKVGTNARLVRMIAADGRIELSQGEVCFTVPAPNKPFPDVDQLIRSLKPSLLGVTLGVRYLERMCKVARQLYPDPKDEPRIRILMGVDNDGPVKFFVEGENGQGLAQGLLMPIGDERNGPATDAEREAAAKLEAELEAAPDNTMLKVYVAESLTIS